MTIIIIIIIYTGKNLQSIPLECKCVVTKLNWGRDSVVDIATRYGLDGLGIESRWGARFSLPVQTGPGAHPTSYIMSTGSLTRG
jgi:hypothetical protein